MRFFTYFFSVLVACSVDFVKAETTSEQTQQAIQAELARQKSLVSQKAASTGHVVDIQALGDKAIMDEIYSITNDLVPWLVENGDGDPDLMMKLLVNPKSDSATIKRFYERLPAAQRSRIEAVSKKIEDYQKRQKNSGAKP